MNKRSLSSSLSLDMHHVLFNKYKPNDTYFNDTIIHTLLLIAVLLFMYLFKGSMILSILTVIILGLVMFRSIVIFHDCVHDSYTSSSLLNYALSFYYGLFACISTNWKTSHGTHHLTNGHLDNPYDFHFNETTVHISFYKNLSPISRSIYKVIIYQ